MYCRQKLAIKFAIIASMILSNCSHYSVIPEDATPFKSVYVHVISNQDFAPNTHNLFQNQLRQTILRDNRLTLAKNPKEADTQLFTTIEDYRRRVNTRSNEDAGRSNSLNLGITIFVSLYSNKTNAYLLKNVPLDSNEYLFFDSLETSVKHREMEYQILPKLTRELSENILELILSDWSMPIN